MIRVTAVSLVLLVVSAACAGGGPPEPTAPPDGVLLRFGGATVAAEVAASPSTQSRGLMQRRHLDRDAGMLFIFPQPMNAGFWMKDTLIPLSIAYLRWEGEGTFTVLKILDMKPCRRDPCPSYFPGLTYDAALEVTKGWFKRNGIEVGSVAETEGTLPTPT